MADLIDRQALRASVIKFLGAQHGISEFAFDNCFPYWIFASEIANAPAVDAEPVKHGTWGKPFKVDADNNGYKCSECGEFGVPCWNYCPNCGAKMDLEGDDVEAD